MANTKDILVASTTELSVNPDVNSRQLSERVAALLSLTQTEKPSSEILEVVAVLMLILEGITINTTSNDVLWLALNGAKIKAKKLGINPELVDEVIHKFDKFSKSVRSSNPLNF